MFHRVAARAEELWHERAPTTHQQRRRPLPQNAAGTGGALHTRALWTGQRSAALGMEAIRARRQECQETSRRCGRAEVGRTASQVAVSYTHLRAHETRHDLVCRLLLEKKKKKNTYTDNKT